MAKIVEKSEKKESKVLFIYIGNDTTTQDGLLLQKNYILEKESVEQIKDEEVLKNIISLQEFIEKKNKEVR